MTFTPMLPLWVLLPATAAMAALAAWQLLRHRGARLAIVWAARLLMVLLLLVLALRPAIPAASSGSSTTGGLEVYFVVDTTSSMAAEDFGSGTDGAASTRLDGVRADIAAIVEQLVGAEFSLVTFDSVAVQRVPLTSDASGLLSANSVLTQEATLYSAGSSVDAPLDLLTTVLGEAQAENPRRSRVLFYFGDGEQTRAVEPRSFEQLAVFVDGGAVLGYGTEEGGRMREFSGYTLDEGLQPSYIKDFTTNPPTDAVSRIDENMLRAIADQFGVDYLHRGPGEAIGPVVDGIEVPPTSTTIADDELPTEFYWIVAVPLGLLALRELFGVVSTIRALPKAAG